jgi:hypothetical protein
MSEQVSFINKIKQLKTFARQNGIDIICKINSPRRELDESGGVIYTSWGAEIFPLEPGTYLDGKRYPYYPDDPEGIGAYAKLGEFWKSLGQRHQNDGCFQSWFDAGIL